MKKLVCFECNLPIIPSDKHVIIGTYHLPRKLKDEVPFHFDCWIKHYNNAVERKVNLLNPIDPKLQKLITEMFFEREGEKKTLIGVLNSKKRGKKIGKPKGKQKN